LLFKPLESLSKDSKYLYPSPSEPLLSALWKMEIILFWQYFSLSFTLWKDTNESLHTGLTVDRGKVIMQTQGPELLMKAGGYVEDNRVEEKKK